MTAVANQDRLALSVLDTVPVDERQTSHEAIATSLAPAELADRLGSTRFWFAEHHNTDSVASITPAILIGITAARTRRNRVGSGGVMLPNHTPLAVAKQFPTLAPATPGRIDLGLGRSSAGDPVVGSLLRTDATVAAEFPRHVDTVSAQTCSSAVRRACSMAIAAWSPHSSSTSHCARAGGRANGGGLDQSTFSK